MKFVTPTTKYTVYASMKYCSNIDRLHFRKSKPMRAKSLEELDGKRFQASTSETMITANQRICTRVCMEKFGDINKKVQKAIFRWSWKDLAKVNRFILVPKITSEALCYCRFSTKSGTREHEKCGLIYQIRDTEQHPISFG